MREIEDFISSQVREQFPNFYKSEGEDFIHFVKVYYEFLEQDGEFLNDSRNLFEFRDIDTTIERFLTSFQEKYMHGIPTNVLGDRRFLQKHILDLYRSKGSIEGVSLLFRLLYNEDVQVRIPSYDILKTSDGKWTEKQYIEISYNPNNESFQDEFITGASSGATAVVNTYEERIVNGRRIYILFVTAVSGQFQSSEIITFPGLAVSDAPTIVGSPNTFVITGSKSGFSIGDFVTIDSNTAVIGKGLKFVVSDVRDSQGGIIKFSIVDGGTRYSVDGVVFVTTGSNTTGSGADFIISSISNTSIFAFNLEVIDDYKTVLLNAADYGFPPGGAEDKNTILGDAFSFTNVDIGTIETLQTLDAGADYDGDVSVLVVDPYTNSANAVILGLAEFGSGIVTDVMLVDSGFGYYTNNQVLILDNVTDSLLTITGNIVLGGVAKSEGFWRGTDGFLNSDKFVQDSFFFQEFSYEIQTTRTLTKYISILKALIHPVGNQLFGKVVVSEQQNIIPVVTRSTVTQS